jgi:hypothetical protein
VRHSGYERAQAQTHKPKCLLELLTTSWFTPMSLGYPWYIFRPCFPSNRVQFRVQFWASFSLFLTPPEPPGKFKPFGLGVLEVASSILSPRLDETLSPSNSMAKSFLI